MNKKTNSRVLLVGHMSFDDRDGRKILGGPPMYQIPVFLSLGFSVDILTSYSDEFKFPYHDKVSSFVIKSESTTEFEFRFQERNNNKSELEDDRILIVRKIACKLVVPKNFKIDKKYDIVLFSGIVGEITLELIKKLAKDPIPIRALDMQTLTRNIEIGKKIKIETDLKILQSTLDYCNLISGSKIELGDLKILSDRATTEEPLKKLLSNSILIRTSSGDPISILHKGRILKFNSDRIPVNQIVDATGSGDIFLTVLVAMILESNDIITCVDMADKITRDHLQISGPPSLIATKEIIEKYLIK